MHQEEFEKVHWLLPGLDGVGSALGKLMLAAL